MTTPSHSQNSPESSLARPVWPRALPAAFVQISALVLALLLGFAIGVTFQSDHDARALADGGLASRSPAPQPALAPAAPPAPAPENAAPGLAAAPQATSAPTSREPLAPSRAAEPLAPAPMATPEARTRNPLSCPTPMFIATRRMASSPTTPSLENSRLSPPPGPRRFPSARRMAAAIASSISRLPGLGELALERGHVRSGGRRRGRCSGRRRRRGRRSSRYGQRWTHSFKTSLPNCVPWKRSLRLGRYFATHGLQGAW